MPGFQHEVMQTLRRRAQRPASTLRSCSRLYRRPRPAAGLPRGQDPQRPTGSQAGGPEKPRSGPAARGGRGTCQGICVFGGSANPGPSDGRGLGALCWGYIALHPKSASLPVGCFRTQNLTPAGGV